MPCKSSSGGGCSCQHLSVDINTSTTSRCRSIYEVVIVLHSIKSRGSPGIWDDARKALPGASRGVRMPLPESNRLRFDDGATQHYLLR